MASIEHMAQTISTPAPVASSLWIWVLLLASQERKSQTWLCIGLHMSVQSMIAIFIPATTSGTGLEVLVPKGCINQEYNHESIKISVEAASGCLGILMPLPIGSKRHYSTGWLGQS